MWLAVCLSRPRSQVKARLRGMAAGDWTVKSNVSLSLLRALLQSDPRPWRSGTDQGPQTVVTVAHNANAHNQRETHTLVPPNQAQIPKKSQGFDSIRLPRRRSGG